MAPAADHDDEIKDEKNPRPLDEDDIALLKTYVLSVKPYICICTQCLKFILGFKICFACAPEISCSRVFLCFRKILFFFILVVDSR